MSRTLRAVLVISLGMNSFLLYSNFYRHPDFDLYSTGLKDAYYVRAHSQDSYIIEHEGHRFTAKCQASLTWLDGINRPGRPMSDGTCTYLPSMVGKSIAAGLMRHEGNNLVYSPWSDSDTVQTADILTVVNDEKEK